MVKYSEIRTISNPHQQTPEIKWIIKQQMARNMGDRLKEDGVMSFKEFGVTEDRHGEMSIQNSLYVVSEKELMDIRRLTMRLEYSLSGLNYIHLKKLQDLIFQHTDIIF